MEGREDQTGTERYRENGDEHQVPLVASTKTGIALFESLGENEVGRIPEGYEDPFTLDTLVSQAQTHADAKKSFILAEVSVPSVVRIAPAADSRMETIKEKPPDAVAPAAGACCDPTRPVATFAVRETKYFYNAHHLNKVLFRKFGDANPPPFIFRLVANNPLTNEEIIGDVKYYIVVDKGGLYHGLNSNFCVARTGSCCGDAPGQDDRPQQQQEASAASTTAGEEAVTQHHHRCGTLSSPKAAPAAAPPALSSVPNLKSLQALTRASIGANKGDLRVAEICVRGREEVEMLRRLQLLGQSQPGWQRAAAAAAPAETASSAESPHDKRLWWSGPLCGSGFLAAGARDEPAAAFDPRGKLTLRRKSVATPDEYAVKISASLRNLAGGDFSAVSRSTVVLRTNQITDAESFFSPSRPPLGLPTSESVGRLPLAHPPQTAAQRDAGKSLPDVGKSLNDGNVLRAVFIGTDDDYLQKSSLRALFAANALHPSDAVLFDIPKETLAAEGIILPRLDEGNSHMSTIILYADPYDDASALMDPSRFSAIFHHAATAAELCGVPNLSTTIFQVDMHGSGYDDYGRSSGHGGSRRGAGAHAHGELRHAGFVDSLFLMMSGDPGSGLPSRPACSTRRAFMLIIYAGFVGLLLMLLPVPAYYTAWVLFSAILSFVLMSITMFLVYHRNDRRRRREAEREMNVNTAL